MCARHGVDKYIDRSSRCTKLPTEKKQSKKLTEQNNPCFIYIAVVLDAHTVDGNEE